MTWERPLCLIEPNQLSYNPTTTDRIQQIKKQLVVVCISGPLRNGKSTLMNRLATFIMGQTPAEKFLTSGNTDPGTRGVWVWYIDHPDDATKGFLLFDIEGLGDTEGDSAHDTYNLCLALLLGSVFVYNVKSSVIEKEIINKLKFVQLAEHIRKMMGESSPESESIGDEPFPHLVIALRDATLTSNKTDKEYMDDVLRAHCEIEMKKRGTFKNCIVKETDGSSNVQKKTGNENVFDFGKDTVLQSNPVSALVFKMLTDYFKQRYCFLFPVPTKLCDDIGETDSLTHDGDDRWNPKFVAKMNCFCDYIYGAPVKTFCNLPLDGTKFVDFLVTYIRHIDDSGYIQHFSDDINKVVDSHNRACIEETVSSFESEIKTVLNDWPIEITHLANTVDLIKRKSDFYMKREFVHFNEELHDNLKERISSVFPKYINESSKNCQDHLAHLFYEHNQNLEMVKEEYDKIEEKGLMGKIEWYDYKLLKIKKEKAKLFCMEIIRHEESGMKYDLLNKITEVNTLIKQIMKNIGDKQLLEKLRKCSVESSTKCQSELCRLFNQCQNLKTVKEEYDKIQNKGLMADVEWCHFATLKLTDENKCTTVKRLSDSKLGAQHKTQSNYELVNLKVYESKEILESVGQRQVANVVQLYMNDSTEVCKEHLTRLFEENGDFKIVKRKYGAIGDKGIMADVEWYQFVLSKIKAFNEDKNSVINSSILKMRDDNPPGDPKHEQEIDKMRWRVKKLGKEIHRGFKKSLDLKIAKKYYGIAEQAQSTYDKLIADLKRKVLLLQLEDKPIEARLVQLEIEQLERKRDSKLDKIMDFLRQLPLVTGLGIALVFYEKTKNFFKQFKSKELLDIDISDLIDE